MIHVVLDTSIFASDPKRTSLPFNALERLLEAGKVELHIPNWVKEELISQLQMDAVAKVSSVATATRELREAFYVPELVEFTKDLQGRVAEMRKFVRDHAGDSFVAWLKLYGAVEYGTKPHHLEAVTQSYFSGKLPFGSRKSRNDIPDAIIWESVLDIHKEHETLHFVVADNRLRSCAQTQSGIVSHKSLADFITNDPCQTLLRELDEQNVYENSIKAMNALVEFDSAWMDDVKEMFKGAIIGHSFRDQEVPPDDHQALITAVHEPQDYNLEYQDAGYYGIGEIEIPMQVFASFKVEYKLPVSAYERIPQSRAEGMDVTELDPFTYLIEEQAELMILGFVDLKMKTEKLKSQHISDEALADVVVTAERHVRVTDVAVMEWL